MPTCRDMSELVTDYLERAVSLRTRLGHVVAPVPMRGVPPLL